MNFQLSMEFYQRFKFYSVYITIDIQHIRVTLIYGSLNVTITWIWEFAIIFIATQTVNILEDFPMDSSSYCFYKKYPIVNLNISTSETETSDTIWYIVQYNKISRVFAESAENTNHSQNNKPKLYRQK